MEQRLNFELITIAYLPLGLVNGKTDKINMWPVD